jgi:hypothetical protein
MADRIETSIALPRSVEVHLTQEGDPTLWQQVLQTVAAIVRNAVFRELSVIRAAPIVPP